MDPDELDLDLQDFLNDEDDDNALVIDVIEPKKNRFEVNLNDEDEDEDAEPVLVIEDPEEDEDQEPEPTPQQPPKESRSKARILELNGDKKRLQQSLQEKDRELQEYKSYMESMNDLYMASEKERLETQIASLKANLTRALADQDTEEYADILVKMNEATAKLQMVNTHSTAAPIKQQQPQQQPQSQNTEPNYSSAASDWMEGKEFLIDNGEYSKLSPDLRKKLYPVRKAMADTARELLSEGWENSDPSFYEELDIRLGLQFDFYETLASEGVDGVQLITKSKSSQEDPSSSATSKPQDKKKKVPVNGPTSTGSQSTSRKNPNKLKLTQEELNWWENHVRYSLGKQNEITLKEYAEMVMQERKQEEAQRN